MHRLKSIKIVPEDLNNESRIEKKLMETLCDTTNKLIQLCNKKELKVSDLKWQPHYSTVFKQLKSQLELILATDTTKTLENLNKIPYLLNLKNNLINLFNSFSKFVQENASLIGTKDHHVRKSFFMKVVHFQFFDLNQDFLQLRKFHSYYHTKNHTHRKELLFEIQAFFPNGVFTPGNVKISKMPARIWWERKFGDNMYVDLDAFIDKFKEDFPFINQAEIFSFRNSINFTSTNITTIFEYDLFTRLYSPWEKVIEVWRLIYSHPAYLHFSTYGDTKDTLSKYLNEPGTYVFRISCKDLGFWTIGYIKATKEMGQVKVDKSNLIEALVEGSKKNMYLYPNGECTNPDLTNINEYRKEIIVNNEDLTLYDCFEAFKECKICRELEKDLQLESCGHQICQTCYKLLRKHNKKLCPFCNQTILSTTKIVNIKDPSIYVGASSAKESSENHYMQMAIQPNLTRNVEIRNSFANADSSNRSHEEGKSESIYSNISDDVTISGDAPPIVPPRIAGENTYGLRQDAKKTVINYPAIYHLNNRNSTAPTTNGPQKKKDPPKYGESSSSIYSEMSLSSNSNHNEDVYCDIKESETISNTLPFSKKNQFNSKNAPGAEEFSFLSKPNGESKNQSASNLSNKLKEMYPISNDDEEYSHPNEDLNEDYSNPNGDDIYLEPSQSQPLCSFSTNNMSIEETYCDATDDIDERSTTDVMFSPWNSYDVKRALRIARDDRILAKEILMEFCAKR